MKNVAKVLDDLNRKVSNTWALTVCGSDWGTSDGEGVEVEDTAAVAVWPVRLGLGRPTKADLDTNWSDVQRWAVGWRTWAQDRPVELVWETRLVSGTRQSVPTHLHVCDLPTAVRLLGGEWEERFVRAQGRYAVLKERFPHAVTPKMLRAVVNFTETDFGLLCHAGTWFADHDATGLTPRQVPIEGLHGKWLNHHQRLIETLAHKPTLGLGKRPTRVHFTYVDPTHLSAGKRAHDSHTLGDASRPDYQPEVVLITENKDTAVLFPARARTITMEGDGKSGPALIPHLDWVHQAQLVIYWGDMDEAGYDILNRYRANGLNVRSVLMDLDTYTTYTRFGATTDDKGVMLPCVSPKPLEHLSEAERAVYALVTDPAWEGPRRVEQERIPFTVALAALRDLEESQVPGSGEGSLTR